MPRAAGGAAGLPPAGLTTAAEGCVVLADPGGVGSLLAGAVKRRAGTAVPAGAPPAEPGGEGPAPAVPLRAVLAPAAWPPPRPCAAAMLLCRRWSR